MNEELKAFVDKNVVMLSPKWSTEEKAMELAMWAIGDGLADLPELDIGQGKGVEQKEYDRAVEEAYSFFKGEIERILS